MWTLLIATQTKPVSLPTCPNNVRVASTTSKTTLVKETGLMDFMWNIYDKLSLDDFDKLSFGQKSKLPHVGHLGVSWGWVFVLWVSSHWASKHVLVRHELCWSILLAHYYLIYIIIILTWRLKCQKKHVRCLGPKRVLPTLCLGSQRPYVFLTLISHFEHDHFTLVRIVMSLSQLSSTQ